MRLTFATDPKKPDIEMAKTISSDPVNPIADTVLINGFVYTMESATQNVEALAICEGKITALGSTAAISKYCARHT